MPSISVRDLCMSYEGRPVWEHLSLDITEPGLVCLLGPNGSGKSTLVKCIDGILRPTGGSVSLDGSDIAMMDVRDLARKVTYVPQSSNEAFSMTVMDTVLMGRYPHTGYRSTVRDLEIASECLKLVGLDELAMRDVDELSGGQHQGVMIARGLAQEPEIMLLDEPTSNLDIKHQVDIMRLLRDIAHGRGIIVIVVSHDLNIASRFSDRMIFLNDGAVFADGPPCEVMTGENIETVYGVSTDIVDVDGRPYAIVRSDD